MRRFLKWTLLVAGALLVLALVAAAGGGVWLWSTLEASRPRLEGADSLDGLSAPVTIERDDRGVPTVRGSSRLDVARATGFLHAQERFFQMDLLRRAAAGELAALFGRALLDADREVRPYRFREVARRDLSEVAPAHRALLEAYAAGVNSGLDALGARPPEYVALRLVPQPWREEDSLLVVLAMYLDLQRGGPRRESDLGVLRDVLPAELADFLAPAGTEWDAPLSGGPLDVPPIPPPETFDLRRQALPLPSRTHGTRDAPLGTEPVLVPGSNNWAVAGSRAALGRALLANDMHLGLSMPNIWYRASLVWPDEDAPGRERRVTGVTLPGTPIVTAGSNGDVAWGFTNSEGDWADLVVLEPDPAREDSYLAPGGPLPFERHDERIEIQGAEPESLEVLGTVWGPVFDRDHRGRRRALRWVALDPVAVDLGLADMERARSLGEALYVAARTGIPSQNCVIADGAGRIGWTLIGPIPRRTGFDGSVPVSWADGSSRWDGYLAPDEVPRIVDPPQGIVWTANNRVADGEMRERIGNGGFDLGARARQIRDGLLALEQPSERDMLALALDDRAVFLERWRSLLLGVLAPEAVRAAPRRAELRRLVEETWTGRASIDSAGYRLVRAFRLFLADQVFDAITAPCKATDGRFEFRRIGQWEGPLWKLVTERPLHLLDPRHASWDDALLAAVDRTLDELSPEKGAPLATRTWGERNTVRVRHPLSLAVPRLARWLDMPPEPLPGDHDMPRVQGPGFGASQRMVVSPGHEENGIFHMPGGQSGHPLAPHYRLGHEAWARGEPTPFLPGPAVHRLTLSPPAVQ